MVTNGWAATFEDARELEQGSEFAQLVLADDEVTDAEMLEANRLLVDCLEAAGFPERCMWSAGTSACRSFGDGTAMIVALTAGIDGEAAV